MIGRGTLNLEEPDELESGSKDVPERRDESCASVSMVATEEKLCCSVESFKVVRWCCGSVRMSSKCCRGDRMFVAAGAIVL